MRSAEILFVKHDFQGFVRNAPELISRQVDQLDDARLMSDTIEELAALLVRAALPRIPVLDVKKTIPSQREVEVTLGPDVDRHPRTTIRRTATEYAFRVPFEGDGDLFKWRGSRFDFNPPSAEVLPSDIVVRVVAMTQPIDAAAVRREFDQTIERIDTYLGWLREDADGLEKALLESARARITQRREKRTNDQAVLGKLGFQGTDGRGEVPGLGFPPREKGT